MATLAPPAAPIFSNAQMSTQQIRTHCELSPDAEKLLERAMQQQGLSARAHDRILKVARTIADLDSLRQHRRPPHRRSHPVPHPRPQLLVIVARSYWA